MKAFILLTMLLLSATGFRVLSAAEDYTTPRTQWQQPDLQGVWNFSSRVPMQRPEELGEREFLTDAEIAAGREQRRRQIGSNRPIRSDNGVEALYNDTIWAENRDADADANVRTSLIIYPPNGRVPLVVEGVDYQPGGERDTAGAFYRCRLVLALMVGQDSDKTVNLLA